MGSARSAPLEAGGQRQHDRHEGRDGDGETPGPGDDVLDHQGRLRMRGWAVSDSAGVARGPTAGPRTATTGPMVPGGHGPPVPVGSPESTPPPRTNPTTASGPPR